MLRFFFLCSFVLLACTCGRAQNINPTYNKVIAAGGLNLRAYRHEILKHVILEK